MPTSDRSESENVGTNEYLQDAQEPGPSGLQTNETSDESYNDCSESSDDDLPLLQIGRGSLNNMEVANPSIRPYSCSECDKRFKHKGQLKTHKQDVHSNEKKYKCKTCSKSFKHKGQLKTHIADKHTENAPRPFGCNQCTKTFKHMGQLKTHKIDKHAGGTSKKYVCYKCKKEFKHKGQLKTHKINLHGHCFCKYCEFSSKSPAKVRRHLRSQCMKKPYKCNVCELSFTQSCNLERHRTNKHPDF